MKSIPPALSLALSQGAAILCHLVRIQTKDQRVFLFSDHDEGFVFQGREVVLGLGLESGLVKQSLGGAETEEGWLQSDLGLSGFRLGLDQAQTLFDAEVEIYWVMPQQPDTNMLLQKLMVTGIEYQDETITEQGHEGLFRLRLSDIRSRLSALQGRRYYKLCDAALGDQTCGLDASFIQNRLCDKHFSTCRDVFQNALNFQGFPDLPGEDHLLHYPKLELIMDGASRGLRS